MSYFGFLAIFLGIPIILLSLLTIVDYQRGKWSPASLSAFPAWKVMLALCLVAFVYTSPWDNYLVATRVWWYDINLVSGIVFGWVPIEEYTFFILQPIMTSLLFLLLIRYLPSSKQAADSKTIRFGATVFALILFVVFAILLSLSFINDAFQPATYLSLELTWALIPIILQFAFGADILWRHGKAIFLAIAISTIYLSWADALAIGAGTWAINPEQSLNFLLFGVLPIEEFVFFLITNILVVFGMTLVLAQESKVRAFALERFAIFRPLLQYFRQTTV
jgi:lycopene cyclase domain-containing protein